ncbi:MAG: transposase [Pseudonocardia sp.]|nr:transposase [Pseudonocardia sp.]
MLSVADPHGRRAHDAYHRFVRVGRWSMTALWRALAVQAVTVLDPAAVVVLDCDDTVYKKTGRAVNGAGTFRDAVRSTRNRVVYAWGLNLVIITLRVTPPWGGCPLGLPINMRMHRKGGPHHRGAVRADDRRDRRLATRLAAAATDWVDADIDERGRIVARQLWHRDVL